MKTRHFSFVGNERRHPCSTIRDKRRHFVSTLVMAKTQHCSVVGDKRRHTTFLLWWWVKTHHFSSSVTSEDKPLFFFGDEWRRATFRLWERGTRHHYFVRPQYSWFLCWCIQTWQCFRILVTFSHKSASNYGRFLCSFTCMSIPRKQAAGCALPPTTTLFVHS